MYDRALAAGNQRRPDRSASDGLFLVGFGRSDHPPAAPATTASPGPHRRRRRHPDPTEQDRPAGSEPAGGHPQRHRLRAAGQPRHVTVEGSVGSSPAWSTSKVLVILAFIKEVGGGDPANLTQEQRDLINVALSESDMDALLAIRGQIPGGSGGTDDGDPALRG